MLRAIASRFSTASARRGRRPWSPAAGGPRRSASGWRRRADLFGRLYILVRDAGGRDRGAGDRETGGDEHSGPEAVRRRFAKRRRLIFRQWNGVFVSRPGVEDQRDDEADERDRHQAAEAGNR